MIGGNAKHQVVRQGNMTRDANSVQVKRFAVKPVKGVKNYGRDKARIYPKITNMERKKKNC